MAADRIIEPDANDVRYGPQQDGRQHDERPTVSVVIATYNRPEPLRHAIASVIAGAFIDWEIVVVGDGCTDDTAECVASFADRRISFHNLPQRSGYQSVPNNTGVGLARGRYIAFLNHDDMFLPDHLAVCVAEIERSGADLVWTSGFMARPRMADTPAGWPCAFELSGVPAGGRYSPYTFYLASSWVVRRDVAVRIGPWLAPEATYLWPSQEWLFRVWRKGADIRFIPKVTVMMVPAGFRSGSYARRESPEHDALRRWMTEIPDYRQRILELLAVTETTRRLHDLHYPSIVRLRRMLMRPLLAMLVFCGVHPHVLSHMVKRRHRGRLLQWHRRTTGAD